MKRNILIFTTLIICACGGSKSSTETNTDTTYGYTEKNPIKVGGEMDGPHNERKYLDALTGPNGETVTYRRQGSCCFFESKSSSFGSGLLDMYRVTYQGNKDTVTLYLNMYEKSTLKAPVGFIYKP